MSDPTTAAQFMARAIQLARKGWCTTTPNPRVGCVLVLDGRIIAEGWHESAGGPHAEVAAIRQARARAVDTRNASAYVTLEPCCVQGRTPPCTQALIDAGIARVVVGAADPNPRVDGGGIEALRQAGIEVRSAVLEAECAALNPGFGLRMRVGRPRFRVKIAMSMDGRTAAANGESQWITGAAARRDVHRLRAESCAVLTGIGTVLADDPQLNVRHVDADRQPARAVLDSHLRMEPGAKLLQCAEDRSIFTRSLEQGRAGALLATGARLIGVDSNDAGQLDLHQIASELAALEYNEVLVEAGAMLAGGFVAAGLADELIIYMAPQLLGSSGRAMLMLPQLQSLSDRFDLEVTDIRRLGDDWRIIARPHPRPVEAQA